MRHKPAWPNLKTNHCPNCDKDFVKYARIEHGVILCKCGFIIEQKRMQEIVTDMNNRRIDFELEQMEKQRQNFKLENEI